MYVVNRAHCLPLCICVYMYVLLNTVNTVLISTYVAMHSKIDSLYLLDEVELISLTWDYYYILSVSLTVTDRIN